MVSKEIIRTVIEQSENLILTKCNRGTTRNSSGTIQEETPRFTPTEDISNDELNNIANVMSERYGLEVSIDKNGKREIGQRKFSLWDDKNKTIIKLDKIVKKHPSWIDFTNNGRGKYDLDEVLQYYDELDPLAKQRIGSISFETSPGASTTSIYDEATDSFNAVKISNMVYTNKRDSDWGLKKVLSHEAGHASESYITQEQQNVLRKAHKPNTQTSYNMGRLDTEREKEVFKDFVRNQKVYRNQASFSDEYNIAMRSNNVRYASDYSSSRGDLDLIKAEDFAETMSAVSYRNSNDKSDFHITYSDGRVVGYEDFVHDHQATFQFCSDWIDGKINHKDLHHPNGVKFH